jgi:hypothetical protein
MENIKLTDNSNKYLTVVDGNIKLKSKQTGLKQIFGYNTQGELIADGKCMTLNKNNNMIYLEDCDESNDNQKWAIGNDKIRQYISNDNKDRCVELNNDMLILNECNNSDIQKWNTENDNDSNTFSWQKFKGKNVVLVEADNPWYINTDDKYELKYPREFILNNELSYRDNADFESNMALDSTKPDLGLGHSYASRKGIKCNKIEKFEDSSYKKYNNINNIVIIITISLLLLVLYKYKK